MIDWKIFNNRIVEVLVKTVLVVFKMTIKKAARKQLL